MARIAIIGGGNIGVALLSGLLESGREAKDLVVAELNAARAHELSQKYGVLVTGVADAAENADYVVIAVKPGDVDGVVSTLADVATAADANSGEQVVVSVAAGVTTEFFESKLPAGSPVVRVMPNTPMLVGAGVSALAPGRFTTDEQLAEVSSIFAAVGSVLTVPEAHMDAVTAVSGSGPAYIMLLAEAMVDAGVAVGLPRAISTDLVSKTLAGSAAMLLDLIERSEDGGIDTSAAQLRASVTSPGGTTAAGLRELERGGLRAAVDAAVAAAKTRSEQLRIT